MVAKFTNLTGMGLPLAVWAATDEYDHNDDPNVISATALIKPLKQIIMSARVEPSSIKSDVAGQLPSRIGTAIHDAVERAWRTNYKTALADLGHPKGLIDKIRIDPSKADLEADPSIVPIYMEQRLHRAIKGKTISGKYDMVLEGKVRDIKTTKAYTRQHRTKDEDYKLQGSIYRWLDPVLITNDIMSIDFIFLDWAGYKVASEKNYPPAKAEEYNIKLLSLDETEKYITDKLDALELHWDSPENKIPSCTPKDLWQDEPKYKYYKNPQKMDRSTKNFDTLHEANARLAADNHVGKVVTVFGKVKACKYCAGAVKCQQKDAYLADGTLTL